MPFCCPFIVSRVIPAGISVAANLIYFPRLRYGTELEIVTWLNEHHMLYAWISLVWVAVDGSLCPSGCHGGDLRREVVLMAAPEKYESYEYDVLSSVWWGGTSRGDRGVSPGGQDRFSLQIAPRQGPYGDGGRWHRGGFENVYPRSNWKVHFRDTMRGGSCSTTGVWPRSMRRRLLKEFSNLKSGALCSIGPRRDSFSSGISGVIATPGSHTSATAPAWK